MFARLAGTGSVELKADRDLTPSRDGVIAENYGKRTTGGYRYPSVSHAFTPAQILDESNTILAHGTPVKGGWENCSMMGMTCSEGESDTKCERGKCRVGTLTAEGSLWRYDSLTVNGLFYYTQGRESVRLKPLSRGRFALPAGAGSVDVTHVASIDTKVYLPPSTYSDENFVRRVIKYLEPDGGVRSLQDSCDNFLRRVLRGDIGSVAVQETVKDRLIAAVSGSLPDVWNAALAAEIEAVWGSRFDGEDLTNLTFLTRCYDLLKVSYGRCIQVVSSSIRTSRVDVSRDIPRPVYGRLPGAAGSYNTYDGEETPAKWLTSGVDDALGWSKWLIDNLYGLVLNPETAYPGYLDWIAQHLGFIGLMWDTQWPNTTKRLLLNNAHVNNIPAGGMWTRESSDANFSRIDLSRIETLIVDEEAGTVSTGDRFQLREYDADSELSTLTGTSSFVVDVSGWQGLIPSRGSMTSLLFLFQVFDIKAFSGEELRYNSADGTYAVRSGLRSSQQSAPVNVPFAVDRVHVGTEADAETGNYPNQLIADLAVYYDNEMSNTVVVRLPFYYNRNGRTWDTVNTIMQAWFPATSNYRVQYAYAAADLLTASDIFFEP